MKNYTYSWNIAIKGYKEVDESRYTEQQIDMSKFINLMSVAIQDAKCGWSSVGYKVMEHPENEIVREYMVLYNSGGHDTRWIPIDGNSKGGNFSVLGENLW